MFSTQTTVDTFAEKKNKKKQNKTKEWQTVQYISQKGIHKS